MLRDGLAAVAEAPPQLLDIAQITAMNINDKRVQDTALK
jgi:hypothetical protein